MLNSVLMFLNYSFVLAFGIVISCLFAGVEITKRNICSALALFVIVCDLQTLLYMLFGLRVVEMLYPLISHVPMLLFLVYYFNRPFSTSCAAILSAYLFTTPRKFLGQLCASVFNDSEIVLYLAQIIFTIPLIYFIYKFVVPSIKGVFEIKGIMPLIFSGFLFLSYIFSYATTVYSDLLYTRNKLAVEFLTTTFVSAIFLFSVLYVKETEKRLRSEHNYNLMLIKSQQAEISLNSMKESQKLTAEYRHDLRHHIHYIKTCLSNNKVAEANAYIDNLYKSFNKIKIETFCQNSDANLVLSYFVSLARAAKIDVRVDTGIPKNLPLSSTDICIVLSNLLENAIKACIKLENPADRKLVISASAKDGKFYLNISNTYNGEAKLINGMPLADKPGHGVGTYSVIEIIKKFNGIYSYETKDNIFTFKALV